MSIEVRSVPLGAGVAPFLAAGRAVLGDDPAWVAPLDFEIRDRLNPKKNPFFEHGEAALFVAVRDGRPVGRISASIDREWQKTWSDHVGHFGFFDTVDDVEVARALVEAAEAWLRERGVDRVLGPMSLGANEEVGLLVEGFEHPPSLMMAHSRAWQGALVEACGYAKEKDLYAWRFDETTPLSKRALKAWEDVRALPEITLRSVDMKRLDEELAIIVDIYNEAWAGKWGFVPITKREVVKMAEDMKLVLDPDIAFVAVREGVPVAMCIMVPNLNEAIADLDGKLFPFGWAKLLWRVKVKHPGSTRLILLGIREQVRKNVKRYGGLSAAMYVEVAKRALGKGYHWSELGWTREDDAPINLGIKAMGGRIYKRYRVYAKTL
jgi:GNAT superfamily N-acetyltransferase